MCCDIIDASFCMGSHRKKHVHTTEGLWVPGLSSCQGRWVLFGILDELVSDKEVLWLAYYKKLIYSRQQHQPHLYQTVEVAILVIPKACLDVVVLLELKNFLVPDIC